MLLTFSKLQFVEAIKKGTKTHTIREDSTNRWKVGMKIHFWFGNPRNTRGKLKPYQFGTGEVARILPIEILPDKNQLFVNGDEYTNTHVLNKIALNDGFKSWDEMKEFFKTDFKGKLIFWGNIEFTDIIEKK